MTTYIIWNLQLLAEGGDGGAGAGPGEGAGTATGVTAGDAGLPDRLAELGVPQDRIEKRRKALERRSTQPKRTAAAAPAPEAQAPKAAEAAPAPDTGTAQPAAQTEQPAAAMTREQMEQDPALKKILDEYANERIRARLKNQSDLQGRLDAFQPAAELLANYYGMDTSDPSRIDLGEISRRVVEDNLYYEDRAMRNGTSVEDEKRASMQAQQQRQLQEQTMRQHFNSLQQQSEALKATYPGFDLGAELRNPAFARLVGPGSLVSVEDAYYAVHRKEIQAAQQEAAQKAAMEAASRSIQAGQARPVENGATPVAAPASAVNVRDKGYRDDLKRRIYAAAARGEKIYPGM